MPDEKFDSPMSCSDSLPVMSNLLRTLLCLLSLIAVGCQPDKDPAPSQPESPQSDEPEPPVANSDTPPTTDHPIRFRDVARDSSVQFVYRNGEDAGHFAILESLGGGAAIFDFDRDGNPDLCFSGGGAFTGTEGAFQVAGARLGLFRNQARWAFEDCTEVAGVIDRTLYSHAVVGHDYDQDGFPDLLVTGFGGVLLYHNEGDGTFTDATHESGLGRVESWNVAAAFGDLNADGHPDLYVTRYVDWSPSNNVVCINGPNQQRDVCPPREFLGLPDALYLSDGRGRFTENSSASGLREDGKGLGVLMVDFDQDRDLDLYVTNDTVDNFLYLNQGDARFEDASLVSGAAVNDRGMADGSMGVDVADFNQDGLPDLFVANYENESFALYRNEGRGLFQHMSRLTGVTAAGGLYVGWGTCFFDCDRDGDEDVYIANGHVIRHPRTAPVRQHAILFENLEGRRFVNVAPSAGDYMSQPHMGRGVATGDIDNDGDLDVVVSHTNEPVALLENLTESNGAWVMLELIGVRSSRNASGAAIEVRTDHKTFRRFVSSGGSYASTSDQREFIGLGGATRISELRIQWPSGIDQIIRDVALDAVHRIVEPFAGSPEF